MTLKESNLVNKNLAKAVQNLQQRMSELEKKQTAIPNDV